MHGHGQSDGDQRQPVREFDDFASRTFSLPPPLALQSIEHHALLLLRNKQGDIGD